METDDASPFDEHASVVSPRVITTVVLCVFVVGMSVGALVSGDNLGFFSSEEPPFTATVDNTVGTNIFMLIEVDEGDNDEEVVIEHILHDFFFTASDRGGLITWDFGDGFTATGSVVNHSYTAPGLYSVSVIESFNGKVNTVILDLIVNLESEAEVDNMECVCAPTAKDTIIPLSDHEGASNLEGYVMVEHDGSSESCSLRNPLQECHLRVLVQRYSGGDLVEESVLFDETFRTNEKVIDFVFNNMELEPGERLQLRLETDQLRDWHKPSAAWSTTAPVLL